MSEKEIILERIKEKERMRVAGRHMTKLFIVTSTLIFVTFIVVWFSQSFPQIIIPEVYQVATLFILVSSGLLVMSQLKITWSRILNLPKSLKKAVRILP